MKLLNDIRKLFCMLMNSIIKQNCIISWLEIFELANIICNKNAQGWPGVLSVGNQEILKLGIQYMYMYFYMETWVHVHVCVTLLILF